MKKGIFSKNNGVLIFILMNRQRSTITDLTVQLILHETEYNYGWKV